MEGPPASREVRINILLEEYKSLRDESEQNMGERLTLLSFLTAAVAVLISGHEAAWAVAVAIALAAAAGAVWYRTWRGLDKRAQHLEGLERRINELALGDSTAQQSLLSWETKLCEHRRSLRDHNNPVTSCWGKLLYRERNESSKPTSGLPQPDAD